MALVLTFPRLTNRGPIEAPRLIAVFKGTLAFPRLTNRGPIEASLDKANIADSVPNFRD